ncbi:MAG: hypothetical protein ACAI35_22340 [Candidatus Methylacidiphilales bacterium]|nr:hypothetical protein [Candidatus Methylacidiphilales bacterium]
MALGFSIGINAGIFGALPLSVAAAESAESSTNQTAPPSVVGVVPENGRWTMKVIAEDSAASSAPAGYPTEAARQIVVTELKYSKTGGTWRVQTQMQGKDVEYWRVGPLLIEPVAGSRLPLVLPSISSTSSQPCYSRGFYGLSWIKPDRFKEKTSFKGTECYHYKGGIPKKATASTAAASPSSSPAEAAAEAATIPPEAWIDVKTLLPVAARFNGTLLEYTFDSAPNSPLTLPPAYQEAWNLYQDQQARLKALMMP